jgi:hypothetical protein
VCVRCQQRRDLRRRELVQPRRDVRLDDAEAVATECVDLRVAQQVALGDHHAMVTNGTTTRRGRIYE